MGDWPSFLDEAGPSPGLSGAADEARDRLVETFVKYIQYIPLSQCLELKCPKKKDLYHQMSTFRSF